MPQTAICVSVVERYEFAFNGVDHLVRVGQQKPDFKSAAAEFDLIHISGKTIFDKN